MSPWRRIESATVVSDTRQPASRRSACSRGEPCSPRAARNAWVTAASSWDRRRSLGVGVRVSHLQNHEDAPRAARRPPCAAPDSWDRTTTRVKPGLCGLVPRWSIGHALSQADFGGSLTRFSGHVGLGDHAAVTAGVCRASNWTRDR